ncbi:FxsA family protein [Microbacteriaceae bacterium 4G12]
MFKVLISLLILIPAIEISLLVASSHWIGIWPTFLIIVTTGVIGAYLAKTQGVAALREIRYRLSRGQMPTESLLDGICILIGGILLVTPGYVTDLLGFLFLFPVTRRPLQYFMFRWIERKIRDKATKNIWK